MGRDKKNGDIESVYEMEDIIQYKREHNTDYYLIKWVGYAVEDATWEPRKNIMDPDDDQKKKMLDLKMKWIENSTDKSSVGSLANRRKRKIGDQKKSSAFDGDSNEGLKTGKKQRNIQSDGNGVTEPWSHDDKTKNFARGNTIERGQSTAECEQSEMRVCREDTRLDNDHTGELATENGLSSNKVLQASQDSCCEPKLPRVVHIRDRGTYLQVLMEFPRPQEEADFPRLWLDMEIARIRYSQELLDYLLARLRIKKPS